MTECRPSCRDHRRSVAPFGVDPVSVLAQEPESRYTDRPGDVATGAVVGRVHPGIDEVRGAPIEHAQHVLLGRVQLGPVPAREHGRGHLDGSTDDRSTLLAPGGDAAVEDRHAIVAVQAQRPPDSRRHRHVPIVVRHDERVVAHATLTHRRGVALRAGNHAGRALDVRQVGVPTGVDSPGDVPGEVLGVTLTVVERAQVPAAVDHPHVRVVEVGGEPVGGHEGSGELDARRRHAPSIARA